MNFPETNQNKAKKGRKPIVYFILAKLSRRIKIGQTYYSSATKRLKQLQSENADDLVLVGVTDKHSELSLHARFEQIRNHNEWFNITPELRAFLKELNGIDLDVTPLCHIGGTIKKERSAVALPVDISALNKLYDELAQ